MADDTKAAAARTAAAAAAAGLEPPPTRAPEPPVLPERVVPQTSLAARGTPPGEVTVQFRRWRAYGQTAYQRGQYAGFPAAVALRLEAAGDVILDPAFKRGVADRIVTK